MSASPQPLSQLTPYGLTMLVHVVFENIDEGRYYYVREREPGETPYDLYGRVTSKSAEGVVMDVIFRRSIVGSNEGAWAIIADDDDEGTYCAYRNLINSVEQEMSARYYLPVASTIVSGTPIDSDSGSDSN
jgi:hypothetical protein